MDQTQIITIYKGPLHGCIPEPQHFERSKKDVLPN